MIMEYLPKYNTRAFSPGLPYMVTSYFKKYYVYNSNHKSDGNIEESDLKDSVLNNIGLKFQNMIQSFGKH